MTKNGITVTYLYSNALYDIYKVSGNGLNEYAERVRNQGYSEQSVLDDYIN